MSKKVLVLMGGFSAERDVSLVTGKNVAQALRNRNYDVVEHDLTYGFGLVKVLETEKPDVVFNALHGNFGEDGEIQGFLDILQIPYTHSGMEASLLGMDKYLTKEICRQNGIRVPNGEKMTFREFKKRGTFLSMPYVVKPVSDGSSVGIFIVRNKEDADKVFYDSDDRQILVEEFIEGKELTCMTLGSKAHVVTELLPQNDEFYNYEAKYTDGATKHVLPAEIPEAAAATCCHYAESLHSLLGCNAISRCDFRYNEKQGVVLLEINTNPGMTALSLAPEQARYIGIDYEKLCSYLVENAKCRKI